MWLDSGVGEFDSGVGELYLSSFFGNEIIVEGNALELCLDLRMAFLSLH